MPRFCGKAGLPAPGWPPWSARHRSKSPETAFSPSSSVSWQHENHHHPAIELNDSPRPGVAPTLLSDNAEFSNPSRRKHLPPKPSHDRCRDATAEAMAMESERARAVPDPPQRWQEVHRPVHSQALRMVFASPNTSQGQPVFRIRNRNHQEKRFDWECLSCFGMWNTVHHRGFPREFGHRTPGMVGR